MWLSVQSVKPKAARPPSAERSRAWLGDMDYPKNQMNIMVLDDSDDDTVDLLEKTVNYYKTKLAGTPRFNYRGWAWIGQSRESGIS